MSMLENVSYLQNIHSFLLSQISRTLRVSQWYRPNCISQPALGLGIAMEWILTNITEWETHKKNCYALSRKCWMMWGLGWHTAMQCAAHQNEKANWPVGLIKRPTPVHVYTANSGLYGRKWNQVSSESLPYELLPLMGSCPWSALRRHPFWKSLQYKCYSQTKSTNFWKIRFSNSLNA